MLFVLDVGNTNTVLGVFKNNELQHEWRIKTDRNKTSDEFGILMHDLFNYKGIDFKDIKDIVISSVVPPIMFSMEKMCKVYFGLEPLIIGKRNITDYIEISYPNPNEIGADRIVNAVSAIEAYGAPLIIVDFGTATTFCYVDEKGIYNGGIIAPGINISLEALYNKASKLPRIEFQRPEQIIGRSTVEAMQAGAYYGYVSQVDGIIKGINHEISQTPKVVATGGIAGHIGKESQMIEIVDNNLTLRGLNLIYHKLKNNS